MILPMAIFSFGGGLVVPNAFVAGLTGSPDHVGTAVSAFGALQMLGNAAVSSLVAALAPHSPLPVAVAIAGLSLLTMILTVAPSVVPPPSLN